jgi:hypothetical protein
MAKEEALLTSIHDNFERAMASTCLLFSFCWRRSCAHFFLSRTAGKEQFSAQMTQIVAGVTGNKTKVWWFACVFLIKFSHMHTTEKLSERLTKERGERDKLRAAYLDLVERERQYHKTVKEYETVRRAFGS